MVLQRSTVLGYEELKSKLNQIRAEEVDAGPVYIYFTGSKLSGTGKSWCPDCVKAESVVEQALTNCSAKVDAIVIVCDVGQRDQWKSPNNLIKADQSLNVRCIPTLLEYSLKSQSFCQGRKLEQDADFEAALNIENFIDSTKT